MVMLVGGRRGHVLDAMSAALRRHQRRMEPPRRVSPRMRVGAGGGAPSAASPHFVYIFYILLVWGPSAVLKE